MKKTCVLILPILILIGQSALGQAITQKPISSLQLLSSAGDSYKNSSYELDWSLGEILTETNGNSTITLTQGFHQSNYTVTAVDQLENMQFEISAFPNPATDYLTLSIEDPHIENFKYFLTDLNGKVLQESKISTNRQQINLMKLPAGLYFLKVRSLNNIEKTFKIIKSN
jgi:hypothetical protein